jgi:hypothetical protein
VVSQNPKIMSETTKTTVTEETHKSGSDERTEVSKKTEIKNNDFDQADQAPKQRVTETTTTTTHEED